MSEDVFTTRSPLIGYAVTGVPPPSPLYVGPDEWLVVDTWSSTAPAPLAIVARVLGPDGKIHTSLYTHTPNTNRTRATTRHQLAEGFLLAVIVDAVGQAYRRGHCWCTVGLQHGVGAAGIVHAALIADYVTGTSRLVWPGGELRNSIEGPGLLRTITTADPAAGQNITQDVPSGARWRLYSAYFSLVTNATAANRYVELDATDGTNLLWSAQYFVAHPASTTRYHSYAVGLQESPVAAGTPRMPIPTPAVLGAGYRILVTASGLQAGDNFSAAQLLVEEWIEP